MSQVYTLRPGIAETSLAAITATANGLTFAIPYMKKGIDIAWQTTFTGIPTSVSTTLQVSMDNSNWATVDTGTNTSGEYRIVGGVIGKYVRLVSGTLSGGTTPTATGLILAL